MNRIAFILCVGAFMSVSAQIWGARPNFLKRQVSGCVDKLDNCQAFGASACSDQQYNQWATENCALTCHKCQSSGPVQVPVMPSVNPQTSGCTDKLSTCAQYGKTVCTDSTYTQWVQTNCQAYCGTCHSTEGATTGTQQIGLNPHSFTHQSTGCVYKGVIHQQGETWKDGCTYKCTCADGSTGKYTCTGICLQWNLPDSCSLNPPAPGKCCKTPNCPSNVQVQYPPDYVAE